MKRQCLKKCKSTSGASLVLALLLFLICAVVGSVVLTAATASVGRISQKKEQLKRQEALSSAAQLIDARMTDTGYEVEGTWNAQDETVTYMTKRYMVAGQSVDTCTMLQDVQRAMGEKLFSGAEWSRSVKWLPDIQGSADGTSSTADTNIVTRKKSTAVLVGTSANTVSYTFSLGKGDVLPTVNAEFSMDANGDIDVQLSCGEEGQAQKMEMKIKAEPIQKRYDEVLGSDQQKMKRVTYTINWTHAAISYGG